MSMTPQEITNKALGLLRQAFIEGRQSKAKTPSFDHQSDVAAWHGSETRREMSKLARETIALFLADQAEPTEITIHHHDE